MRVCGGTGTTGVRVADALAVSLAPESIQQKHPQLSRAQIHAALAYYYDHEGDCERKGDHKGRPYIREDSTAGRQ